MKNFSLYRIFVIVRMFIKFVLQLYIFGKKHKAWDASTREEWETLVAKQAIEYRERALDLEGLMIKVGQFLSTRADIMPEAFLRELQDLIDQVPPVPPEVSKAIIEKEWGQPLDYFLLDISDRPVASASIGEVYKGTLLNGQEVAIKVQRADIDKIIKSDFKAMNIVLWITRNFTRFGKEIDTKALYKEVVSVVGDELNYYKELRNAQYFQKKYNGSESIYIPQFYEEYCTRRVLVMEWIEARKVTDLVWYREHQIDPIATAEKLFLFLVDQLLDYGKFHADPHQGNIMIKSDGTLIILDFGMVGQISRNDARNVRKMIQGFVMDDYQLAIEQLEKLGFLLPHADKYKIEQKLREYIDIYLEQNINEMDQEIVQEIFEDLQEFVREQPIQLPAEFAFLGRAASIGLGVITSLNPSIDFMTLGKPVVNQWMQEKEDDEDALQIQLVKDTLKPFLSLPRHLNEFLEAPEQKRQQEEVHHWSRLEHQRFLLLTALQVIILLATIGFTAAGWFLNSTIVLSLSGIVAVLLLITLMITIFRHKRFIQSNSRFES
ncbi:ABC1 kinase family protein [Salisediminibacterium beveridgei]|uniref:Ubiquinone biosynthesis monooxygenase UbiB n=1 Tax=Salisediminibacterium beveridgei TaxID=632773 RepID=A0A1D7QTT6_9BACI|nr:AarF/UbiB family protein [Salisediminibacterium beveridgei]AOM82433.1 Ubiquinone biosynthesis monooxygenase UbiB [Salisediminibacterium beveridgei]